MKNRFVVMSDTHFQAPQGRGAKPIKDLSWWNRMLFTRQGAIADSLVSTVRSLAPDFTIHCGDLTNHGDVESFLYGKEIMDRLGCPYFVVPGNHDTYRHGTRKAVAPLFGLADGKFCYRRDLAGMRFLFLDCAYWLTRAGGDSEHLPGREERLGIGPSQEQLAWLQQELGAAPDRTSFIVTHPPLCAKPVYPVGSLPAVAHIESTPPPRPTLQTMLTPCTIPLSLRNEALLEMIAGAPNVRAVFAGHWHIVDATFNRGVLHCQAASLIEFPFELRVVEIDRGMMSVASVGLDDPSLREASLVPQWGNRWVEGSPEDRELTVSLG